MQIQVHTDNHISGSVELTGKVEEIVSATLERHSARITRVEVHLTDENSSQKSSDADKRCVMEARLAGMQPITVTADASSVDQAIDDAADKLLSALDTRIGKQEHTKGRTSFSGE